MACISIAIRLAISLHLFHYIPLLCLALMYVFHDSHFSYIQSQKMATCTQTTEADIDYVLEQLPNIVGKLRKLQAILAG